MNSENIATRLKLFIDSQGLTNSQFADAAGIPRPSLSQFLTGRNKKVSNEFVSQIHAAYPLLNVMWFLFGEGDMLSVPSEDASKGGEMEEEAGRKSNPYDSGISELFDSPFSERDIPENPYNGTSVSEYSRQTPLSDDQNGVKSFENELVESQKLISSLQGEIDKIRSNPRKVVQIMIYYDDSTFETFIPR